MPNWLIVLLVILTTLTMVSILGEWLAGRMRR